MHRIERDFHGRTLSIETGRIAKQASGSVLVRCGDTVVLATACGGGERGLDFLPLSVDYVEKQYAAGKIPGSFFRREGKLSERETLISRLIDRPIRPLFPEYFNKDIQVITMVLSVDEDNDPDVLAMCGASAALSLSELPFEGPVAAVRVTKVDGKLVINPNRAQKEKAELNMVVAGTRDAITMVEGEAEQIPEAELLEALFFAHQELQTIIKMQDELVAKSGKPKMEWSPPARDEQFIASVKKFLTPRFEKAIRIAEKLARRDAYSKITEEMKSEFLKEDDPQVDTKAKTASRVYEDVLYHMVRDMAFDEARRIDGRDTKTVRPIEIEVGVLPRTHGSALFQRGETQAIVVATLGTEDDAQRLDSLLGEEFKRFMLHYNFPAYSVGEVKPLRGAGRREVGHGYLAERAIRSVLPPASEFPYVLRIVSEVTESNGSSSMATVCGSSLALMDAGVPIAAPVAGVAMGLMQDGKRSVILTDILGDEDHLGDMDFKVCGTERGVTSIQMDIKIKGLEKPTVGAALEQAREARLHILKQMAEVIGTPRKEMSKYAPRIVTIKINTERIRDLIGPGGKTIRSISESCGVKIDVEDDGTVNVASNDGMRLENALKVIKSLTQEAEVGKIYKGVVKRIADFGAFVEILPGTDGLLHISQIADERIRRVTDVLDEGDEVYVKVLDVDRQGKIRLSRKEAMAELKEQGAQ